jgi:tetratricopeptide (TPR) repeat protein
MPLRRLLAASRLLAAAGVHRTGLAAVATSAALIVAPTPTHAYGGLDNYQLSAEEVALLPEFCRHTQLIIERHGSPVAQRQWIERVGPGFLHMHHYCIAVVAYVRSHRHQNTANDRAGYLNFAAQNLSYVVRNAEPQFAFMPEVLYRRGQVVFRQGNASAAIADLERAVQGDPRHARASYELSQVLLSIGEKARAERVLKQALEASPTSKLLTSALRDLNSRNLKQ